MGSRKYSKGKEYALMVEGNKNTKSKENKNVKENMSKSKIEDESSKPTDEYSVKKVEKKGRTSKCSYCKNGFHLKNQCFKKNLYIMSQFLEKHNIDVPYELEKPVESS